jgi:DNA-binding NtrC family response regulator
MNVIIIEDNEEIARLQCRFLQAKGDNCLPVTARFADMLVVGLLWGDADAVVVDLNLGEDDNGAGLTGLDVLQWVAEHYPEVRRILSTAATITPEMRDCVHTVLRKPYTINDLHSAIHDV